MTVNPIPEGFHTVTPYLIVDDVSRLLTFLENAFGAEVTERMEAPGGGGVMHACVRIGDSHVMMGAAKGEWQAAPTMLYLYVEDVDAMYKRALEAGAESVHEPRDEFYGDRNAGLKGPCGNFWWVATHVEDVSHEEMERRAAEAQAQQTEA